MTAETDDRDFDLFISYATDPDYALSRNLESFLESFHQLPNPDRVELRPLRVCVDGSDFHSNNEIGSTITDYLARCDGLLVLGSTNARASQWVNDEVRWFLDRRPDRIRVALTEGGDPAHAEEVLPQLLVDAGFHRRIAYDFRGAKRGAKERWRAVRDFEDERTRLAADLYGKPAGEISPIWFREQRRRTRNQLRASIGAGLVLLLLLAVAVYFFFSARAEARRAWRQSYIASTNLALRAWNEGSIDLAKETLDTQVPHDGQEDLRGFEWSHIRRRVTAERRRLFVDKVAFHAVDVSPDGALVAAGGRLWGEETTGDNPAHHVYVWSLLDGKLVADLQGHEEEISSVAFSPAAPLLASAGDDAVRIWDLRIKQQVHRFDTTYNRSVTFSRDGAALAFLESNRVVVCETVNWTKCVSTYVNQPSALVFSPDGKRIAAVGEESLDLLDRATMKPLHSEAFAGGSAVAWSPQNVIAVGHGSRVMLIDGATSKSFGFYLEYEHPVGSLAFSRDGHILAIGEGDPTNLDSGRSITLFDLRARVDRGVLRGHPRRVFSMAATPDGGLVSAGEEETVRVWDLEKASYLHGVAFPSDTPVWSMTFTQGGGRLLASDGNGRLHVASIRGEKPVESVAAHSRRFDLSLSSSGLLATAGFDGKVFLWTNSAPSRLLFEDAKSPLMTSIAFSPNAQTLAVGNCDGSIRFWGAPGFAAPQIRKQAACAGFMAWSPDSRVVVSGGGDPANEASPRSVFVWDPNENRPIQTLSAHKSWPHAAAFSPDGKLLVTGDWSGELIVWDTRKWKRKLDPLRGHGDVVVGVSFTPSGKSIVSASRDGTVRIWDAVTGQERAVLADAGGDLHSFAMSAQGDIVAAATEQGKVSFWLADGATVMRSRGVAPQTTPPTPLPDSSH